MGAVIRSWHMAGAATSLTLPACSTASCRDVSTTVPLWWSARSQPSEQWIWRPPRGVRFGPAPADIYPVWDEVIAWEAAEDLPALAHDGVAIDRTGLGAPSPAPRQVFAIGLNYHDHAAESGFDSPTTLPPLFTKYVSSFSGPDSEVRIPAGGNVDWEVELVVVIGRETSRVEPAPGRTSRV